MQTSNFWIPKDNPDRVSISRGVPKDYNGKRYLKLAPEWDWVKKPEDEFRKLYAQLLDKLDAQEVYDELGEDAILVCWEPPGNFCHRRIVAEWFEKELGIEVPELE
jgi:hypothetical protein